MIPETFPPVPRVVVVCRSKVAARAIIAAHTPIPSDHPQLRYASTERDLLGCTDSMAYVDLSQARLSPRAEQPVVHLPYGRTAGGARFDHHAARALGALETARRLGLQPLAITALQSRFDETSKTS